MKPPILLIHGYSAESHDSNYDQIKNIYGDLASDLQQKMGAQIEEIDLSRWISMEDGITLDDVSRALNRALHISKPHLLMSGFHVIVHSTGALVIRNWIRLFSPKPSPIINLIHLAGANFGSGLAHIGKGQMARWGRYLLQNGAEPGVQILGELELGSSKTLDLHRHFLFAHNRMLEDYHIHEYCIIGTQANPAAYEYPIRYCKEDGSDGVVRVAAGNLNWNYIQITPDPDKALMPWSEVKSIKGSFQNRVGHVDGVYVVTNNISNGKNGLSEIPFAIPYLCSHGGEDMGVVSGSKTKSSVLPLLVKALSIARNDMQSYRALVQMFHDTTRESHDRVVKEQAPGWTPWAEDPRNQYDPHAQVIFRIRDQDGRPVKHFDVFFDAPVNQPDSLPIRELFEDKHVNQHTPGCICFYLRLAQFEKSAGTWVSKLSQVRECTLEISATEPETEDIAYLPVRYTLSGSALEGLLQVHRTTVVDITLLRLPSADVFNIIRY
ncbi:MAG: hypothetical protein HC904_00055 [Blastochloris sp.]|nr:hypothetical protein [Blastochloris sp.]